MILEADKIGLSYGADVVLRDVTFSVNENDRIGIVGYNGCGKTTLLKIITGQLEQTCGIISLRTNAIMGYLEQTAGLNPKNTVLREMESVNNADELLAQMKKLEAEMGTDTEKISEYEAVCQKYDAIDGYNMSYNIRRVLSGMNFAESAYAKKVDVLSGGEKTRLALAKLLIMSPDLLVLDEPTNHLDIETLEWLEKFLSEYKGALLAVSHDRHFLDEIMNKTLEIQNGKSKLYTGNFSQYLAQKELNENAQQKSYRQTVEKAQKLKEYAEKNIVRASTSKMAKSRLKMLDRLDLEAPESSSHENVRFRIESQSQPYKEVLTIKNLSVSAGGKKLVDNLSLVLRREERLAIIGANGTGKTTLLRTILGKYRPDSGSVRQGGGVKTSLFEQNLFNISARDPISYIWDKYPSMNQLEIRSLLAGVGFFGDDVFTEAKGLSGGELARLNLARISLEHPNLLILDEPTNHLDIYTKDVLYKALADYEGSLIAVSHDRYLIEILGGKILLLKDGGSYDIFENYENYKNGVPMSEEDLNLPEPEKEENRQKIAVEEADSAVNQKELRRQRAQERERKSHVENELQRLEAEVASTECLINDSEIATDHEKLSQLCEKLEEDKAQLSLLFDEWVEKFSS
ncbi:MAG: ABC-F family ATP-binding cassette domain-containing protein [Oscillospiraceae bacterium]